MFLNSSESPTQIGDDISFDEPFRMRSSECKIDQKKKMFYFYFYFFKHQHVVNYIILV
jgi:hypothetical protein